MRTVLLAIGLLQLFDSTHIAAVTFENCKENNDAKL